MATIRSSHALNWVHTPTNSTCITFSSSSQTENRSCPRRFAGFKFSCLFSVSSRIFFFLKQPVGEQSTIPSQVRLQSAAIDGQFLRCVLQALAFGLQAGAVGTICRRRPVFHPGVLPQHVDESETERGQACSHYYPSLFLTLQPCRLERCFCKGWVRVKYPDHTFPDRSVN